MVDLVRWLQVTNALAWCWPAYLCAPAMWRGMRGHGTAADAAPGTVFWIALLQIFFIIRWMVWPKSIDGMAADELVWWASCYALSTALALRKVHLFLRGRA